MASEIAPGTIGLVKMGGSGGRLIRIGQLLNGDGFADWEHAFVYLGDVKGAGVTVGTGQVLEAEPGGAVIRPMHYGDVHWCEGIARLLAPGAGVTAVARGLEGVQYSWADYAALTARRLRIPVPGLRAYVASTGHMICSQLADELYARLGVSIFRDGRWPGYVTPAALYQRDLELRRDTR